MRRLNLLTTAASVAAVLVCLAFSLVLGLVVGAEAVPGETTRIAVRQVPDDARSADLERAFRQAAIAGDGVLVSCIHRQSATDECRWIAGDERHAADLRTDFFDPAAARTYSPADAATVPSWTGEWEFAGASPEAMLAALRERGIPAQRTPDATIGDALFGLAGAQLPQVTLAVLLAGVLAFLLVGLAKHRSVAVLGANGWRDARIVVALGAGPVRGLLLIGASGVALGSVAAGMWNGWTGIPRFALVALAAYCAYALLACAALALGIVVGGRGGTERGAGGDATAARAAFRSGLVARIAAVTVVLLAVVGAGTAVADWRGLERWRARWEDSGPVHQVTVGQAVLGDDAALHRSAAYLRRALAPGGVAAHPTALLDGPPGAEPIVVTTPAGAARIAPGAPAADAPALVIPPGMVDGEPRRRVEEFLGFQAELRAGEDGVPGDSARPSPPVVPAQREFTVNTWTYQDADRNAEAFRSAVLPRAAVLVVDPEQLSDDWLVAAASRGELVLVGETAELSERLAADPDARWLTRVRPMREGALDLIARAGRDAAVHLLALGLTAAVGLASLAVLIAAWWARHGYAAGIRELHGWSAAGIRRPALLAVTLPVLIGAVLALAIHPVSELLSWAGALILVDCLLAWWGIGLLGRPALRTRLGDAE